MDQKTYNYLSWTAVLGTLGLVIFAWGDRVQWDIGGLNVYQWFPLFGLIAWTIMAQHYYLGAVRVLVHGLKKPKYFKEITGYLVLASLLLHPGLLAYEQSRNDQGLPLESFTNYVGDGLRIAVMLGTISLIIFLSFEVFERIKKNRTISRYWWLISISQSLAMILIWIHAVRLGSDLGSGWFQVVWYVLGAALIPCFYIIHKSDFESR